MDKDKVEQENYCLQAKQLCDMLRTRIMQIDNFPNKQHYYGQLRKIKYIVDDIYWKV